MKKSSFSLLLARNDQEMNALVEQTDKKTLALWAIDCAARVLPYFETQFPHDPRPRRALETLRKWIDTGVFSMAVVRKASLDAHRAAKDVGEDTPARSAAHACGQAVATAHVSTHSMGPAIYGQQAVYRAAVSDRENAAVRERDWQVQHLLALRETGAV